MNVLIPEQETEQEPKQELVLGSDRRALEHYHLTAPYPAKPNLAPFPPLEVHQNPVTLIKKVSQAIGMPATSFLTLETNLKTSNGVVQRVAEAIFKTNCPESYVSLSTQIVIARQGLILSIEPHPDSYARALALAYPDTGLFVGRSIKRIAVLPRERSWSEHVGLVLPGEIETFEWPAPETDPTDPYDNPIGLIS